jgi:TfoX/Sxy family transcriptional regulator of competence genes
MAALRGQPAFAQVRCDSQKHTGKTTIAEHEGTGAMAYDEETAERVRKLLSGEKDLVAKKMMGGLCFMVNGNMCCVVSGKGGLLVRVGPDAFERTLAEPHVLPMEMGGRIMTGFVRIAPEGYRTAAALKKWVERGVSFVATLPKGKTKKPTAKKAPAKKAVARKAAAKPKPARLMQWEAKRQR